MLMIRKNCLVCRSSATVDVENSLLNVVAGICMTGNAGVTRTGSTDALGEIGTAAACTLLLYLVRLHHGHL